MEVVGMIVLFLVGVLMGTSLKLIDNKGKSKGTLFIDISDPNNPYPYLGLAKSEDLDDIRKAKYVILEVVSHK